MFFTRRFFVVLAVVFALYLASYAFPVCYEAARWLGYILLTLSSIDVMWGETLESKKRRPMALFYSILFGILFGSLFVLLSPSKLSLVFSAVTLILVCFLLPYKKRSETITARRSCSDRFSNGDENEVRITVENHDLHPVHVDIIDELNQVFPSAYFNIGGDEAPSTRWQQCKRCQDKAKEQGIDTKHLQQYFTKRMEQYINGKGKTMIGWDEILEGELAKSTIVLSRRYLSTWTKAAKAGHNVITCPGRYAYFDYYQAKNTLHEPQAIGSFLPVEQVYSFNPRPDTVSADITSRIIGVQGNLWTEYVPTTAQAEYMVLPRMAALAEVQWMPAARKNYTEFVERATRLARLYDHYGYAYALHIWPERYNHNRTDW